jgi:hypothetical protein
MPIHDWTRVDAGIFHDFHHEWISTIKRALNGGLLPPGHYALAEQIAGGLAPDVLTLQAPANGPPAPVPGGSTGAIALATAVPKVYFHTRTAIDYYAAKAKAVVIRHVSEHRIIAVIEVVSPGNKASRHGLRTFIEKALELLRGGVHLLVADLFPPTRRDPQGIHRALWDELTENDFTLPSDRPLTMASYIGGPNPEAFVEPAAVGRPLPEMPLFLAPDEYIQVPLEATYQSAFEAVPAFWRDVLEPPAAG